MVDKITNPPSQKDLIDKVNELVDGKQDTISDLATIRSGASAGATAVQPADLSTYVTTNTAQDITARKTFFGEKAIYFKQNTASNKLGFTLYNNNNKEVGALEFRPNSINSIPILTLNSSSPLASSQLYGNSYVGFRYWLYSLNIIAPFSTNLASKNLFIPVTFTNGTTTVESTSTDGSVDISSLLPTKTSDLANDSGYITSSALNGYATESYVTTAVSGKQDTLVSGTNIKTINNTSILGSGNIDIQGGGSYTAGTGIDIANDVISVEGVKDQRNTSTAIKTWTGTRAQYDAIVSKDSNTLYNITDDTNTTLTLLEALYPVGSVYITTASTCPLSTLISGSTWQLVSSGRVLQGADSGHSAGTTIEAGLPNITSGYWYGVYANYDTTEVAGSAIRRAGDYHSDSNVSSGDYRSNYDLDASRSSSIYGNSDTVQPPAYVVNIFRRTL